MEAISLQRLSLVAPALSRKVQAAAEAFALEGGFFRVVSGLRTYAEQDALYAQGRSTPGHIVTNARGGYSNHNPGCAVDCIPFLTGESGELNWNPASPQFQAMVSALKAQGLVWGGAWSSIKDAPHFQLANVPTTPTDLDRQLYASGGLNAIWSHYGVL